MKDPLKLLGMLPVFSSLDHEDLRLLADLVEEAEYEKGVTLLSPGDRPDRMWVIEDGAVELSLVVADDVEKPVLTARKGGQIGALSLLTETTWPGIARVVERTRTVLLRRERVDQLLEAHPRVGLRILRALAGALAQQFALIMDLYRNNLRWTMEATNAVGLDLQHLVSDRAEVEVTLSNGARHKGVLLKFDPGDAGYQLLLRTEEGRIAIVPYHAVVEIGCAADAAPSTIDGLPSQ
jgi:CRP-like cAMP-binding protein